MKELLLILFTLNHVFAAPSCYANRWPHLAIDWGTFNYFAATTDTFTDTITQWNGADSSLTSQAAKVTSSGMTTDYGTLQLGCLPAGTYRISATVFPGSDRCAINMTFAWSTGSQSFTWDIYHDSSNQLRTRANDLVFPKNTTYTLNMKAGNTHAVSGGCYVVFASKLFHINRIDSGMSSDTSQCNFDVWPHISLTWSVFSYLGDLGDTGALLVFEWSGPDTSLATFIGTQTVGHNFGYAYFGCMPAGIYRISTDAAMNSVRCNSTFTLEPTGYPVKTWSWNLNNPTDINIKTRAEEITFPGNTTYKLKLESLNSKPVGGSGCELVWGVRKLYIDRLF